MSVTLRFAPMLLLTACLLTGIVSGMQAQDTIFLKRVQADNPYPFYHAIYIDTAKTIPDFSFSHFDSTTYFGEIKDLGPLHKKTGLPKALPRKWILLYLYKDKYYTYSPSEAGEDFKFEITDSTTIDYSMEGPEPSKINNIATRSSRKYLVTRTNTGLSKTVKINIINPQKGIAVFSFGPTRYNKAGHKELMVSTDKAQLFKRIINFSQTQKEAEFDFDKIDFLKLERQ